ncbi:MAG: hypothetical protein AB2L20_09580 [Mangrovibacterium sp.]
MLKLTHHEVFGFIKTDIDIHTLGLATITNLLKDCGYKTVIAPEEVSVAVTAIKKVNNLGIVIKWIKDNNITFLGFSYRLDPVDGKDYFCDLYYHLKEKHMFLNNGGKIKGISFAGLPDTCKYIEQELGDNCILFAGDESPVESLMKFGVPRSIFPHELLQESAYDKLRWSFAEKLIASEKYKSIMPQDHYGYAECATLSDSYIKRLAYCRKNHSLPIIRAHVGPYNSNRIEALKEFTSWTKELAQTRLLDVLSIGSSQLTQSNFGEDWEGKPNGGGVPINSEIEYKYIAENAKPMLIRTYAGTKDVPTMAQIHERSLNISWHALSFWWFCEIDGRGKNTVFENLKEHLATIRYIASIGKPLEPNIPHHFSFRGADDITYIVSGYLAAKTAKMLGITHLILQNMLNTPKYTWGVQDLAKGRAMLKLVRELEDNNFSVSLQLRAGLDYFAPDIEKAKVQLAAVTALMDDIEPNEPDSPEIIHVVSYSEAVRLASPIVIKESIQITLCALQEYRELRSCNKVDNMEYDKDVARRTKELYEEAKESICILERNIPDLYSAKGLYKVFYYGFFPVPYMLDPDKKYPNATKWRTALKNGGIRVVDEKGMVIHTPKRYKGIISNGEITADSLEN